MGTEMTSDTSHDLAHDAIEYLKQTAISSSPSTSHRASNYWLRDPALFREFEIIVFKTETKRYTLVPSRDLLVHENNGDPGYDLFTITWNPEADPHETTPIFKYVHDGVDDSPVPRVTDPDPSKSRLFSMEAKVSGAFLPCIFVALGWLREKDVAIPGPVSEGRTQTTYYVVLLNLSTDPVSVWLMFDYHIEDEDGDCFRWTNRLGDYHNHLCPSEFQNGMRLPRREDRFPPTPTENVTSLRDFFRQGSNLDNRDKSISQGNGFDKRDPSAAFSQGSNQVDDAVNHVPADKLGKDDTGYFGLPRQDLALLAPDIMAWSDQGFPAEQVITCLRGSHVHLGSSLRAQTATDEQVDRIKQNRISFKHLQFS
ncbi:MAG: hypothetical protein Q9208_007260 [Pyrenodesmia sp. 3 TL-2023]